jgi:hypothetical protein
VVEAAPPAATEVVFLQEVVVVEEDLQVAQMVALVELVLEFLDMDFLEEVQVLALLLAAAEVVVLVVLVFLVLPPRELSVVQDLPIQFPVVL